MDAGWDTDQFLTDIAEATMVMLSVVRNVSYNQIYWDSLLMIFLHFSLRRKKINCYYLF